MRWFPYHLCRAYAELFRFCHFFFTRYTTSLHSFPLLFTTDHPPRSLDTFCPINHLTPGGILTVADDLLKNDGQKFLEMMEQLAVARATREEQNIRDLQDETEDDYDEKDE